jgi:predicted NUDIX family NTP pyrophosphohydrolase
MKKSAGLVLYRRTPAGLRILLGHMGGPYYAKKEQGAWTIPKGIIEEGEDPLQAALRECEEELGIVPAGKPVALGPIVQRGGKQVVAWAVEHDSDTVYVKSVPFSIEWPPRSGKQSTFPEIDRARWFSVAEASRFAVTGQADLFVQLERLLGA